MKRKMFIIALLLSSIFVLSSVASAGWFAVTVNQAGIDATTGAGFVQLTYVSGPGSWTGARWFVASSANAKTVLAVGLSAISINSQCTVRLDSTNEWSVLTGFFMKAQ
jgi:hypothetical protein